MTFSITQILKAMGIVLVNGWIRTRFRIQMHSKFCIQKQFIWEACCDIKVSQKLLQWVQLPLSSLFPKWWNWDIWMWLNEWHLKSSENSHQTWHKTCWRLLGMDSPHWKDRRRRKSDKSVRKKWSDDSW